MRGGRPPLEADPPEGRPGVCSRPPGAFRPKALPPRASTTAGRRPRPPEGEAARGLAPPPTRPPRPGRDRPWEVPVEEA
eukprot:6040551-Lingulodinium_polyedra.AAC.1